MKKFFWFLAIFLLFLIAVVNAVLLMPPTSWARKLMVDQVSAATGLKLDINGHVSLRLLPNLNLHVEDAVLTNPSIPGGAPLLTARVIEVSTDILPLLRGNWTINHVHLVEPTIAGHIDAAGKPNWLVDAGTRADAGSARAPGAVSRAQTTGTPGAGADTAQSASTAYRVRTLSFSGGNITFDDQSRHWKATVRNADGSATDVTSAGAATAAIKGQTIAISQGGDSTTASFDGLEASARSITAAGTIADAAFRATAAVISDRQSHVAATLENASGNAAGISSAGIASAGIKGGRITVRDETSKTVARLEGADGTASGITASGIETAGLNSATAVIVDEAGGRSADVAGLDMRAAALTSTSLGRLILTATKLDMRPEPNGPRIVVDRASGRINRLTPEAATGIAITGQRLAIRNPAGGIMMWSEAPTFDIPTASITAMELRNAVFTSSALSIGEPTRATSPSLSKVSLTAPLIAFGKPLEPTVDFIWKGEHVTGQVSLPAPEAIALSPGLPAKLSLNSSLAKLDFAGVITTAPTATRADPPMLKGRLRGSTPSLQAVSKWLGYQLASGADGAASLEGEWENRSQSIALTNGRIEHDGQVVTGTVEIDNSGERPRIKGRLDAARLDADRYLGLAAAAATRAPARITRGGAATPPPADEAAVKAAVTEQLREDLKAYLGAVLAQPVTRGRLNTSVELPPQPAMSRTLRGNAIAKSALQWDDTPFPVAGLKAVDLDLDLSIQSLKLRGLDIKVPKLMTKLANGSLTLEGENLTTESGRLSGIAMLDASQPVPTATARLRAEGLDVYALLAVLGPNPVLAGASSVDAEVTSRGHSQKQLVEALTGKVSARIDRGDIVGYDLTSIWSLLGLVSNASYNGSRRTPFQALTATMVLDNGVSRDSRMDLSGKAIEADGNGTIKLSAREIDYRAQVKLSSYFRRLAVRLLGDWSAPKFGLDYGTFASKPDGTMNPLEVFGDGVFADREIARLAGDVLTRAGPGGVEPGFARFLADLQTRGANAPGGR